MARSWMTWMLLPMAAMLLGWGTLPLMAQQRGAAQLLRQRYLSDTTGKIREYYVFLPRGYSEETGKRWPLLLFLHGAGERGNGMEDLERVLIHGPLMEAWIQERDLPFVMVVPQAPFPDDRRNTGAMPKGFGEMRRPGEAAPARLAPDMEGGPIPESWGELRDRSEGGFSAVIQAWDRMHKEIVFMLRTAAQDFRVDRSRIYLSGLSMGGYGTFALAARYPQVFAAVAPLCGGGDPESLDAFAKAGRPVWVFHGGRDTVVPPKESLRMVNALLAKGHPQVPFTIHADLGHNVWTRVYESKDFYDWLLAQSLPTTSSRQGSR